MKLSALIRLKATQWLFLSIAAIASTAIAAPSASTPVVFLGGDTAAGWQEAGADTWKRDFDAGSHKAINLSRAGEIPSDTLRRLSDGLLDYVDARVLVYAPDLPALTPDRSVLDDTLDIRAVLRLLARLRPDATVVLTAIPSHGTNINDAARVRGDLVNHAIGCYVYRMTQGLKRPKLRMCNFNGLMLDGNGRLGVKMSPDGSRLAPAAYEAWSAALKPYLDEAIDGAALRGTAPRPPVAFEMTVTPRFAQVSKSWLACGSSAQNAAKKNITPNDRLADKRREFRANTSRHFDLVMIGDSITHRFETGPGKDEWARLSAGRKVLNLGFGGNSIRNALWNVKHGGFLDGVTVDVITLMIGTNNRGDDEKFIAEAIKEVLAAIRAKQPHAKIILHPMTPRVRPDHAELRAKNDRANAIIRTFANGKDIVLVDLNPLYENASPEKLKELLPDGTHPGPEGYRAWREALEPFLPPADDDGNAPSRMTLIPGGDSAVFEATERPQAVLCFSNATRRAQTFQAECRTEDYFGRKVSSEIVNGTAPASGIFSHTLSLPENCAPGFYCTTVKWSGAGAKGEEECSFVKVGPRPASLDPLFGISAFGHDRAELYAKLGVGTKAVYLDWRMLDDGKGNLKLNEVAAYIKSLRAAGIVVEGHIPAVGAIPRRYLKKKPGPQEDPVANPSAMYADMQTFVEALVARFKDDVHMWSASGEINLLAGRAPYYRQRYLDVVRLISGAIHKVDPSAKLLALGCSGADGRDNPRFRFLQGMLPELIEYIDGLGIDQYTAGQHYGAGFSPLNSEQSGLRPIMQRALEIARTNNIKIVGIDEKGPAIVRSTPISSPDGRRMADMVARDFIILKTLPEVRHWLYFRPRNWNPRSIVDWGMWEGPNPRQVVSAYAATARQMAHAEFIREKTLHQSIVCWIFKNGAGPFATIWHNGAEPLAFVLPRGSAVSVHDVQGNPVAVEKDALLLSESPLYIRAGSIEALDSLLDGAKYDAADLDGVAETVAEGRTILALRNITGNELSARVVALDCQPPAPIPAAAAKGVRLAPGEIGKIELDASPAQSRFTVESSAGRRLTVEGSFAPYRVRRIRGWAEIEKADEIMLEDPERQTPGYADLRANKLYTGLDDLSARARFGYDESRFYIEVKVRDDVHFNESAPARSFTGDCVQFAFDTLRNGAFDALAGKSGWGDDDYRFTCALASGRPSTYCYGAGAANRARMDSREYSAPEIVRDEKAKVTRYRLSIPFADLAPLAPEAGRVFGFAFLAFDKDAARGALYRIESAPGLAGATAPEKFQPFVLAPSTDD